MRTYNGHIFGDNYSERNFWEGVKHSFKSGNDLTKLIYINIGVFLLIKILTVLGWLFGISGFGVILGNFCAIPANAEELLYRIWTPFTYMFLHYGFLHLLFNMLWLYWFGTLFLEFIGNRKIIPLYILGGLTGAGFFVLAYNIFPAFAEAKEEAIAIGASASVMAFVFAVGFYRPNYRIRLFLIGSVKVIHIAIFSVIIDLLSIPEGNAGGHIAHLGGALYGYLYAVNLKRGTDITDFFVAIVRPITGLFKKSTKRNPRMKVRYGKGYSAVNDREYNAQKKQNQERINHILDKISKSGYESLTAEEKEILFKSGRN